MMQNYYWDEFIHEIQSCVESGYVLLDAGAGDCQWKSHFPSAKYIGMDLGIGDSECDYSNLDIRRFPANKLPAVFDSAQPACTLSGVEG